MPDTRHRCGLRSIALLIAAATLAIATGCSSGDRPRHDPVRLAEICAQLPGERIGEVTITASQRFEPSAATGDAGLCKVSATRAPFLDLEVVVPDDWSGRLYHQGGAGFDGVVPSALLLNAQGNPSQLHPVVRDKGAIYTASNGGNRSDVPGEAAPMVWASGTPEGQQSAQDYAYEALGTTMHFAKAIGQRFFTVPPRRTYFGGCSNGGRNAYLVAELWPQEYDGIVAGCETMDMAGQAAAWLQVGSRAGTPAALSADQYQAAFDRITHACDHTDGVQDAYLADAGACQMDPVVLQCRAPTADPDPALCLNPEQVDTLQVMLSDAQLAGGQTVYSAYNWSDFSVFGPAFGALGGGFALLATDDAGWLLPQRQQAFDLDTDYPALRDGLLARGADHDRGAIARYLAEGGRLISWHAIGDNLLSARDHARNFESMTHQAQALGLANPADHARLFMVPTNTHGAGQAPQEVDWVSAIIAWVEEGRAPEQLQYHFLQPGDATPRTLPVCQHPMTPRYVGGDHHLASSYRCVASPEP